LVLALCPVFGCVVALFGAGLQPVRADAYIPEPVVQQNVAVIADHLPAVARCPSRGVNCGAQCADWWVQEHRAIPGQPPAKHG